MGPGGMGPGGMGPGGMGPGGMGPGGMGPGGRRRGGPMGGMNGQPDQQTFPTDNTNPTVGKRLSYKSKNKVFFLFNLRNSDVWILNFIFIQLFFWKRKK